MTSPAPVATPCAGTAARPPEPAFTPPGLLGVAGPLVELLFGLLVGLLFGVLVCPALVAAIEELAGVDPAVLLAGVLVTAAVVLAGELL